MGGARKPLAHKKGWKYKAFSILSKSITQKIPADMLKKAMNKAVVKKCES